MQSKITGAKISADGVHKRGGEYIESELQAAVDRKEINGPVADEIIAQGENRKSWLIFCVGVQHSYNIRDELIDRGISAATITGETPKAFMFKWRAVECALKVTPTIAEFLILLV